MLDELEEDDEQLVETELEDAEFEQVLDAELEVLVEVGKKERVFELAELRVEVRIVEDAVLVVDDRIMSVFTEI